MKRKKKQLLAELYGMLMVLLVEVESKRARKDSKKYHWDDIEHEINTYSKKKLKELSTGK